MAILLAALTFSLIDFDVFHAKAKTANDWVLSRFDWLFSLASFAAVLLVAWVMTSTKGIEGVRQLSNLGGLPGLFILIAMGGVIVRMRLRWFDEIKAGSQPATIPDTPKPPGSIE